MHQSERTSDLKAHYEETIQEEEFPLLAEILDQGPQTEAGLVLEAIIQATVEEEKSQWILCDVCRSKDCSLSRRV